MGKKREKFSAFTSSIQFQVVHGDLNRQVVPIYVNGVSEPILVLSYSDFVGWIRLEGGAAVWRYGSLRTGGVSSPRAVGNLETKAGPIIDAIAASVREVGPVSPAVNPVDGEPAEFVRSIENGQRPPAWSRSPRTFDRNDRGSAPAAAPKPSVDALHPQPAVEFSPYIHTLERNPAAPGFTEKQLDGAPLITVYPAVIPSVIGAFFLVVAFLGAPYEFYVVMRWAVSAMAIWMCVIAGQQKRTAWGLVFAAAALLFNPLIPVTATRDFWIIPDGLGAALFATAGFKLRASRPATKDDKAAF
ncbi:DUF6804 family protein [Pseudarthrobacter sp. LMD1-1-1.1]|uniref:DUF6804 family protein n=1 Tax=Pseudarthrobacter sp. LMD1-1-1.1 TaxID=3135242 RepID=UPI0034439541